MCSSRDSVWSFNIETTSIVLSRGWMPFSNLQYIARQNLIQSIVIVKTGYRMFYISYIEDVNEIVNDISRSIENTL